ncbi:hypothetical protein [Tabrizicola sp.]|uniref:hypothetical protein n=1 Tax=Tabrizicola sp. TaxID=2005166 RepID=UPI00273432CE|nr:hypothetical protein [Tabrizicola sp.]MDP3195416.1 hypothetical protein [Tabrizicola sp.]
MPKATAIFAGPFRVRADDARDITPTSPLRQALLAVLILAPRQMKARKSLQSMFWGSADAAHAAANLRTALYQLRQDLMPLGPEVLQADRQMVSLSPGVIAADLGADTGLDLLEGLDLPLADCDGFEDWLRSLRQSGSPTDAAETPATSADVGATSRIRPAPRVDRPLRMALGLLPTVHLGPPPGAVLGQVEATIDQIAQFLKVFTLLDVHDFRDPCARSVPLPVASAQGPTHLLQSQIQHDGTGVRLRLRLLEAHSRKLLWLSQPVTQRELDQEATPWRLGESILDCMRLHPPPAGAPDLFPFTALAAFFSLDPQEIDRAEVQLQRMVADGGHPVLECLQLFAQVFRVNEHLGASVEIDTERLLNTLADLSNADPMLPVCQSLLGYALHMLRAENDQAFHLIENANRLAPNFALNLDHLAVIHLVRGDLDGADAAWRRLNLVGQNSPWRYTYDITGAMIHLMRGDLRQSLYFANQSMFRKPRYLAALRYSMIGLALSNRSEDAARMLDRIRVLRPGYDLSHWADGFVTRMPVHLAKAAVQSLRRVELL